VTPSGASTPLATRISTVLHEHSTEGSLSNATQVPGTATLNVGGGAQVSYVACATTPYCSAVGVYKDALGRQLVWVSNEAKGVWSNAVEIPGTALLTVGNVSDVNGIACPAAGSCTAVGDYTDADGNLQGFVVDEVNGAWGDAQQTPGLGFLNVGGAATTLAVSCSTPGNCSAGGTFADAAGHLESFGVREANGTWDTAQAIAAAQLNEGDSEMDWISCPSSGGCIGVGTFVDSAGNTQSYWVTEVSDTWLIQNETLGDASLNLGGDMEYNSVSCPTQASCSAGGYYTGAAGDEEGFVVNEVGGTWQAATEIPGLAALNAGGAAAIYTVSCTDATSCTGVGNYTDESGNQQAFVVDETDGTWGSAQEAPGSGALNAGGLANLNDVDCTSPGNCNAGGYYSTSVPTQTTTSEQPFIIGEVEGTWNTAREVPGVASLNVGVNAQILSTACSSFENCVDAGFYVDASGHLQALTVNESFTPVADKMRITVVQVTKVTKHEVTVVGLKISASGLGDATGVVKFSNGSVLLCTGKISKGTAKCSIARHVAKGAISITAKFAGDLFNQPAVATTKVAAK
jgi:hypothetical protein